LQSGEVWMELKALRKHGWSISALAREFGMSRNTVRRELASERPRGYPERAKPTALTPAQLAHVERRLATCPKMRGSDLHLELLEDFGYLGSYRAFTRHLVVVRPPAVRDPEIRFGRPTLGSRRRPTGPISVCGLWATGSPSANIQPPCSSRRAVSRRVRPEKHFRPPPGNLS
jgi:transposase-like protein